MDRVKKYFYGLSKNTFLLAFASFFSDVSTEMLYPILPIFLSQNLHASGSIIGIIEGFAQALQYIIQGFSGWLSDKLRKQKAIALIGYFIAALAKPLMGLSTAWQGVLFARSFDRFGTGIRSAPRDALIAASADKAHRGKAFGLEGVGDNLGAFIGPLLTVILLMFIFNIRFIFYLATIPGLLAFCMVLLIKQKSSAANAKVSIDIHVNQFSKSFWKYLLVTALFAIGNSSNVFLILETKNVGISLQQTILIYAGFNLIAALISYPAGFLSDRYGRKKILLISFMIFIVSYLGFAMSKNVYAIALLFIFYGFYQGIFRSVGKALAIDLSPASMHASAVGWYNTVIGIMQLIASIVAGFLWDQVSHSAVFYYGTFTAILGSLALMLVVKEDATQ